VFGTEVDLDEGVLLEVVVGGHDIQVRLEPSGNARGGNEVLPALRLGVEPEEVECAQSLGFGEADSHIGDRQGVLGEQPGRGRQGAALRLSSQGGHQLVPPEAQLP
jgi:hypothetical protein